MWEQTALDERRKAFLGAGVVALVLAGIGQAISGAVGSGQDPDLITAIAWVVLAADVPVLGLVLLTPAAASRMQAGSAGGPEGFVKVARNLSRLGAALAFVPTVVGFALLLISGDPWRMYAFVGLSAATGAFYWARIGSLLAGLGPEGTPEPPL